MKFFDKLFQNKKEDDFSSDNARLLKLIRIYWKDHENISKWIDVKNELTSTRPVLFIPVPNHTNKQPDTWTQQELSTLRFNAEVLDGLLVLGAFTDKQSLINRYKNPQEVTAIKSCDLIKIVLPTKIDRIIINNLQKDWFFLLRHYDNEEEYKPAPNSTISLWVPAKKPNEEFINDLCSNFDELGTIELVYFCGHTVNNARAYVLGIKLKINSENAQKAIINTFHRTVIKHKLTFDMPVDMDFIKPEELKEQYYIKLNSIVYTSSKV